MARPKKDNADYHTHDKDMRNDPKIRALRKKYGHEGYAVFNMMLEVLTDSDNWCYHWNELNIELLKGDFDSEKVEEIINYCAATLKLFTIDNGIIYSYQHQKRFKPLLLKRKRDINRVFDSENPHSKVKYSKVKESKEERENTHTPEFFFKDGLNKSEEGMLAGKFTPPEFEEVGQFFYDKLKAHWDGSKCNLVAQKFFNHYKSLCWKTAAGADVEDWQALANKWILKDLEDATKGKQVGARNVLPSVKVLTLDQLKQKFIDNTIVLTDVHYTHYDEVKLLGCVITNDHYNIAKTKRAESLISSNKATDQQLANDYLKKIETERTEHDKDKIGTLAMRYAVRDWLYNDCVAKQ